jgi:hypothetical protein
MGKGLRHCLQWLVSAPLLYAQEQAPMAPTELRADVSGTMVELFWTESREATGYEISFRQGDNDWMNTSIIPASGGSAVGGLEEFAEYSFRVRAHNDFGDSEYTPVITLTTEATPRAPPAPGAIRLKEATYDRLTIEWDAVPEAEGYQLGVRRGSESVGSYTDLWGTGGYASHTIINLRADTEVSFQLCAVNQMGKSAFTDWFTFKTLARPGPQAELTFLGTERAGGMGWAEHYGSEGYKVAYGGEKLPDYATVERWPPTYWWADPTGDPREALAEPGSSKSVAATFYGSLELHLTIHGTNPREVSFYCMDWDHLGRMQKMEVVDVASEVVLDSREISDFGDGIYISYRVLGDVRFVMRPTSGSAVFSGIFFGGTLPGPLSNPPRLQLRRLGEEFELTIQSGGSGNYVVERSSDLKNWSTAASGGLTAQTQTVSLPAADASAWFRVRLE